jgi:hypothetical protein
VSGGDSATDNEMMASAAIVTPPDASSVHYLHEAEPICAIGGSGMTHLLDKRHDGYRCAPRRPNRVPEGRPW